MEDADEEWKRSEYSSEGEAKNDVGKARWVLNRGLRLGKQILVASFLASSAPLLLPPLVVVSVIGISVSMPYGLFLASHACTHKLMSKLLPMPTPNVVLQPRQEQDQDRKLEEETKDEPQVSQHTIIQGEEEASPQVGVDDKTTGNDIGEFEVTNVVALEEFESDDEDKELEKETKGLLEKIRDEGTSDTRGSDQRIGPIVEGDDEDIKDVDDGNGRDSQTPISSGQEVQDYSILVEKADASEVADESGFDLFKETSIDPQDHTYTIDLHGDSSNAMVDEHAEPREPTVLYAQHKCTQFEYSSAKDSTTRPSPCNEVMLNEEKIWKEINAMRLIVGYEGTPQASCVDELKNLYIFTGVEPPTHLNHSSNPLEINDKLHFLMSILGVKSSVP